MRITDALLGEHGGIVGLLDHVARCASGWDLDQAREGGASLAAVLRPHAAAEEELLFAALERAFGHEPAPLAVLRLEHEEIEAILAEVTAASSIAGLRGRFDRLVELMADHLAKEEGFLFPLARQRLDEETLGRLGSRWAAARRVDVGD